MQFEMMSQIFHDEFGIVWRRIILILIDKEKNSSDKKFHHAIKLFHDRMQKSHNDLWRCQAGIVMLRAQTDLLLDSLLDGLDKPRRRLVQHIFRNGLSNGNEKKLWNCQLPALRKLLKPLPQLIREYEFALLPSLRVIQTKFSDSLSTLNFKDVAVSAGALLFSIATHSKLVGDLWLQALLNVDLNSVGVGPAGMRIEIIHPNNSLRRRSIFLHPDSEMLLMAHASKYGFPINLSFPGASPKKIYRNCLSALSKEMKLSGDVYKTLIDRLSVMARPALILQVPGYLYGCAIDVNQTTAVTPYVCSRILGEIWNSVSLPVPKTKSKSKSTPAVPNLSLSIVSSDRTSYLRKINQFLGQYARQKQTLSAFEVTRIIENLSASVDVLWPIELLLRDYAIHMLSKRDYGMLAPASVVRYFSALWKILLASAEDINVSELDADSFADLYDHALILAPSETSRYYLQSRLIDFHRWLVNTKNVPEIKFSELDNYTTSSGVVNANLITPTEFRISRSKLEDLSHIPDDYLREASINIFTLLFRCGMRKREVLQLRICDYRKHSHALKIRPSKYGSIKSSQSIRNLPLAVLLEPDELNRFNHWFDTVSALSIFQGTDQNLLFSAQSNPQAFVNEQMIVESIMDVVREVCADPLLVLHVLRHSFANWTLVRLQLTTGGLHLPAGCPAFSDRIFDIESCRVLKATLYNFSSIRESDPGRRDLYCVTSLLGHLSPSTTLRSYFHLSDLLIRFFHTDRNPKNYRVKDIANITGYTDKRIYQLTKQNNVKNEKVFDLMLKILRDVIITERNGGIAIEGTKPKRLYSNHHTRVSVI